MRLANAQQPTTRGVADQDRLGHGANLDSAVSALRVAEARSIPRRTAGAAQPALHRSPAPPAIYFREARWCSARPVLSIMPPGNMKLRFFVPETELPKLAIGDEVSDLRQLRRRSHRKDLLIAPPRNTPPVSTASMSATSWSIGSRRGPRGRTVCASASRFSVYLNENPVADKR